MKMSRNTYRYLIVNDVSALTEGYLFHMISLIKFNIVSGHFGSRCKSGTVSQQP